MKIRINLIYIFCLFFTLSVQAVDLAKVRKEAAAPIKSIDHYLSLKKTSKTGVELPMALRRVQYNILSFNNRLTLGTDAQTNDAVLKKTIEDSIDYYSDECERAKPAKSTYCGGLTTKLADYKTKYSADYKPKKPNYPEVDLEKYTYTLEGKTYDLKNLMYVDTTKRTTASPAVTASATTTTSATAAASATAKETKTTTEYSCEWDTALPPRKLLYAPGCSGSGKVCSGFVKCTKNGYKINRLATCGSEFCSDSSATECAKQLGYGSKTVTADGQAVPNSSTSKKQNGGGGVN